MICAYQYSNKNSVFRFKPNQAFSQGKGWFLIKMEFPWLSYSPERQSLLFIMGIYYRKDRVQKILFWEQKTEILLIYVLEKVRNTVLTCILQNLTPWEFWESKVSSWTQRTFLSRHSINQDFTRDHWTFYTQTIQYYSW